MQRLVEMGFDIGVNGCSMKTAENVAVVKEVPLERLQIETDGPWCEMRASHASAKYMEGAPPLGFKAVKKEKWQKGLMVKGRNESVTIVHVAHVIAGIKQISIDEVCEVYVQCSIRYSTGGHGANITSGLSRIQQKCSVSGSRPRQRRNKIRAIWQPQVGHGNKRRCHVMLLHRFAHSSRHEVVDRSNVRGVASRVTVGDSMAGDAVVRVLPLQEFFVQAVVRRNLGVL